MSGSNSPPMSEKYSKDQEWCLLPGSLAEEEIPTIYSNVVHHIFVDFLCEVHVDAKEIRICLSLPRSSESATSLAQAR